MYNSSFTESTQINKNVEVQNKFNKGSDEKEIVVDRQEKNLQENNKAAIGDSSHSLENKKQTAFVLTNPIYEDLSTTSTTTNEESGDKLQPHSNEEKEKVLFETKSLKEKKLDSNVEERDKSQTIENTRNNKTFTIIDPNESLTKESDLENLTVLNEKENSSKPVEISGKESVKDQNNIKTVKPAERITSDKMHNQENSNKVIDSNEECLKTTDDQLYVDMKSGVVIKLDENNFSEAGTDLKNTSSETELKETDAPSCSSLKVHHAEQPEVAKSEVTIENASDQVSPISREENALKNLSDKLFAIKIEINKVEDCCEINKTNEEKVLIGEKNPAEKIESNKVCDIEEKKHFKEMKSFPVEINFTSLNNHKVSTKTDKVFEQKSTEVNIDKSLISTLNSEHSSQMSEELIKTQKNFKLMEDKNQDFENIIISKHINEKVFKKSDCEESIDLVNDSPEGNIKQENSEFRIITEPTKVVFNRAVLIKPFDNTEQQKCIKTDEKEKLNKINNSSNEKDINRSDVQAVVENMIEKVVSKNKPIEKDLVISSTSKSQDKSQSELSMQNVVIFELNNNDKSVVKNSGNFDSKPDSPADHDAKKENDFKKFDPEEKEVLGVEKCEINAKDLYLECMKLESEPKKSNEKDVYKRENISETSTINLTQNISTTDKLKESELSPASSLLSPTSSFSGFVPIIAKTDKPELFLELDEGIVDAYCKSAKVSDLRKFWESKS